VLVYAFWPKFKALEPNEWGDFLAGAFGPLALGWVVLGFFQQGKELRNSVKALELQTSELKASVAQQSRFATNTERQLKLAETQSQIELQNYLPNFHPQIKSSPNTGGSPTGSYSVEALNTGYDATDVKISCSGTHKAEIINSFARLVQSQKDIKFRLNFPKNLDDTRSQMLEIKSVGAGGHIKVQRYHMNAFDFERVD
jgi:hypothetical protein